MLPQSSHSCSVSWMRLCFQHSQQSLFAEPIGAQIMAVGAAVAPGLNTDQHRCQRFLSRHGVVGWYHWLQLPLLLMMLCQLCDRFCLASCNCSN